MSSGTATEQEIIRQVIRGERSWAGLATVGINARFTGDGCQIENPNDVRVAADIRDLAHGLLANLRSPRDLRTWAFLLEAESFVDWGPSESHAAWEPLWDAVWKASFGDPVPEEAVKIAEQLRA